MDDQDRPPAVETVEKAETALDSQRRGARDSMFLNATLRRANGVPSYPVRVRNLSAGGIMADCNEVFVVGEAVELELRRVGVQFGSIAWVEGNRVGIGFDRPINPALARTPVGVVRSTALAPEPSVRTARPLPGAATPGGMAYAAIGPLRPNTTSPKRPGFRRS